MYYVLVTLLQQQPIQIHRQYQHMQNKLPRDQCNLENIKPIQKNQSITKAQLILETFIKGQLGLISLEIGFSGRISRPTYPLKSAAITLQIQPICALTFETFLARRLSQNRFAGHCQHSMSLSTCTLAVLLITCTPFFRRD